MLSTRCAVLGMPVAHSLSPAMHRAAYSELDLEDHRYDAVEVDDDGLAEFLEGLDASWRGLSLTMPLKRRAIPLMDTLDDWATTSGAVNTVLLSEHRRLGFNTDVPGAMAALLERVHEPLGEVVVLGGGATATSTLLAAVELGCDRARLLVRDPARAEVTLRQVLAHRRQPRVSVELLDEAIGRGDVGGDLVVSTVPTTAQTPEVLAATAQVPVVFDVVYDPWPTPLVQSAQGSGRVCVTGLDLLAHQAVLQLQVMVGRSVPAELLRAAALRELRSRGHVHDGAVDSAETGPATL